MTLHEILTARSDNYHKLDKILVELCDMLFSAQKKNPEHYGLVAACVVDPMGRRATGINHIINNGKRVHAERDAVRNYEQANGPLPEGSMVVTTLSPCVEPMSDRHGISCSELMNDLNIRKVYCGYLDPTQDTHVHNNYECVETQNEQLKNICKEVADCFLKRDITEFAPTADRDNDGNEPDYVLELANRWWNAADPDKQDRIAATLKSLGYAISQVESEDDAVQITHLPTGHVFFISADEFDPDLFEISDELRRNYLARADQQVSNRMDHMARVRDRLNKGYEIYHADRPAGATQIVDRFEADTPEQARRYYEQYIQNYESDRDFDLRLRRATGIMENQSVSTEDIIGYIRKYHDSNLHSDYTDYITNTFTGFELKDIPVNSIKTDLPKLDSSKVEQYKTMDFSKAPPIVIGDGFILDGYHRANVAKALGIPTIKAYVGIKRVNEITMVPTVAKSKRQHLDVMPNDGRPIPKGDESHYLGNLVAEMGDGFQLWSWKSRWDITYYVFDTNTRICQLATTGKQYPENPNSFVVMGLYSGPKNRVRAADLYAFLVINRGLTLVSDNKQSEGGYRVWQELEKRFGKKINIHGFDTRTDKGVNVTTKDEPDTHVSRSEVKKAGPHMKKELGSISRDLRFVASAK